MFRTRITEIFLQNFSYTTNKITVLEVESLGLNMVIAAGNVSEQKTPRSALKSTESTKTAHKAVGAPV